MTIPKLVCFASIWLPATMLSLQAIAQEPQPLLPRSSADQARLQLHSPAMDHWATDLRYRRINGQWWYLLKNNRWALWNGEKWTLPAQAASFQQQRRPQFSERDNRAGPDDEIVRRREVDHWRSMAAGAPRANGSLAQSDSEYHQQMDRFHNTLRATPYDYRIGTPGHGLFDCDPDRVIANTGRFNYATSSGGYMGSAMQGPFGY